MSVKCIIGGQFYNGQKYWIREGEPDIQYSSENECKAYVTNGGVEVPGAWVEDDTLTIYQKPLDHIKAALGNYKENPVIPIVIAILVLIILYKLYNGRK